MDSSHGLRYNSNEEELESQITKSSLNTISTGQVASFPVLVYTFSSDYTTNVDLQGNWEADTYNMGQNNRRRTNDDSHRVVAQTSLSNVPSKYCSLTRKGIIDRAKDVSPIRSTLAEEQNSTNFKKTWHENKKFHRQDKKFYTDLMNSKLKTRLCILHITKITSNAL